MGIIRDDDTEIVLYNPFTGEPFFAYNKNTDKLDAKGKDLENLGSVKTGKTTYTKASEGNTKVVETYPNDTETNGATKTQGTTVGTTDTDILNIGERGAVVLVVGRDTAGNTNDFTDIINYSRTGGETVISSNSGGAAARIYSNSSTATGIALSMESGEYNVTAVCLAVVEG